MTFDTLAKWLADRLAEPVHPDPDLADYADAAAVIREAGREAARLGLTPLVERCQVGAFVAPRTARGILSEAVRIVRQARRDEDQASANAPRREWYTVACLAELTGRPPADIREDLREPAVVRAYKAPGTQYWRLSPNEGRKYLELWKAGRLRSHPRRQA